MSGVQQTDSPSSPPSGRVVGTRVPRVEDARLLTGRGRYVDDVQRSGMLHACFVRSPLARARIASVDVEKACAVAGVRGVLTGADINGEVVDLWYSQVGPDVPRTPLPPLAEGEVRFAGDPVALVVADDRYVAEDAAELVAVDYEPLDAVVDLHAALDSDSLVHEGWAGNVCAELATPTDHLAEAFANAAHVVETEIHQQAYVACPLETRGLVVEWSPADGSLSVWASSQSPHDFRQFASRLLGVAEHKIRVICQDTGGGFGQKINAHREDIVLLLAARHFPAPLKYIEDRRENLMASSSRRESGRVRMALNAEGVVQAATIDHLSNAGAYPIPYPLISSAAVGAIFPGPLKYQLGAFSTKCVFTNTPGLTAYRGPWEFETLAREVSLDAAARQIGVDPAELRRRNMLSRHDLPHTNALGMTLTDMTPLETLELALEAVEYEVFRQEQDEARAQGRYLGIGISSYVEPTTTNMPHHGSEGATIRVEPSGTVNVYLAGGSAGNSLETTAIQLTADALDVDVGVVNTVQGDTALTPFGSGTAGSRSGSMVAGAIRETAAILRNRIAEVAADALGVRAEVIEVAGGSAFVEANPINALTLAEVAHHAYFGKDAAGGLEASARYHTQAPNLWANASHICTVEVDIETGLVRILRYVVAEDCGPMINPNVVEGQIAGGVVQGIGGALLEHFEWDVDGNPLATTFVDYLLPSTTDVPIIEYLHMEGSPGPGPGGFKGVGEGGAIGAPAAVANAVADALSPFGVELRELPLSPATLLRHLADGGAG
ncbi:MAG: xanthine dehydrogenase family protein molybdopterin-binding subunit [Acidimicrobiales bacterium]|nr:xanthine dehydrogenase family protein molybdopterin-binding subunit [Acidimicrobiales bacterium]